MGRSKRSDNAAFSFEATDCDLTFIDDGRFLELALYGPSGPPAVISITEAAMIEVVGQFLKQRLFGLH